MPRTLFRPENQFSAESEFFTEEEWHDYQGARTPVYGWLPHLRWISAGEEKVLVNPENGGWAAFTPREHRALAERAQTPKGRMGEAFYRLGLCTKAGSARAFPERTAHPSDLYFFEFAVTTECTLGCTYCFADAKSKTKGQAASPSLAELFINRIAEYRAQSRTNNVFVIEFSGGEPLMNFDVVKHTVEYASRTYGDLLNARYCLQTNATLLNPDVLAFANENEIGIGISCDGFQAAHDRHRPFLSGRSSHAIVERNIHDLLSANPDNSGSVISVITGDSVQSMAEIALYLYCLGFKEVILRPIGGLGRGQRDQAALCAEQYVDGLFNVLKSVIEPCYQEFGMVLEERFLALTFKHLLFPRRPFMCERTPCGAARNISVTTPSGDVYACNQGTTMDAFRLGSLRSSSFLELLKSPAARSLANRIVKEINECGYCEYSGWCDSPCPVGAFRKFGSIHAKSAECEMLKLRYARALRGLLADEFDLEVIGRLVGSETSISWLEF
jgi:radical SAM protein with 4Fe4S-binding SPASM domain